MKNIAITIRLKHPSRDPNEITEALGLAPTRCWKAGAPRMTPTGSPLPGSYLESFWYKRLTIPDGSTIEEATEAGIEVLTGAREFLREFSSAGGTSELFIGWFRGPGGVLDADLLAVLADLRVGLSLDVYLEASEIAGLESTNE